MAKQYDATSKFLIEFRPADWLRVAGLSVPDAVEAVTLVDAELSTITAASDKLVHVEDGPRSYIAHVEFQVSTDATFDSRVLLYNVLARSRHKLPVRSVAFLMRPEAMTNVSGRVVEPDVDGTALDFSYRLVKVWELAVEPLLSGPLGTLPLAPLAATDPNKLPDVLDAIRSRLDREPVESRPQEIWAASRLLLPLKYKSTLLDSLMLNLLDLQESSVFQEIITKGRVEGRVEGRLEGERDILRRLATERFGEPTSEQQRRLDAVTSQSQIDQLVEKMFNASNWDDLLAE